MSGNKNRFGKWIDPRTAGEIVVSYDAGGEFQLVIDGTEFAHQVNEVTTKMDGAEHGFVPSLTITIPAHVVRFEHRGDRHFMPDRLTTDDATSESSSGSDAAA